MPKRRPGGRKNKYPLAEMAVGDSFFAPKCKGLAIPKRPELLANRKFVLHFLTEDGVPGVHLWRVE